MPNAYAEENILASKTTAANNIINTESNKKRETAKTQIISAVSTFASNLAGAQRFSRIETVLPQLDPRLRLAPCTLPLETRSTSPHKKIGKFTLKVSCLDQKNWALHVPLELKAYENVVVTTQPIYRGQLLTQQNIIEEEREITRLNQGYFNRSSVALGAIAKRSIPSNKVIRPQFVQPAMLVNKGERIVIQAAIHGLSIKTTGVALTAGGLGDLIQVKNSRTQRIVEGRISAPGQIRISL
ncbi:flagella basal body P-ring formation protein FlgA [Gammaproteobacteria bacterium 45_16_T64]|nr:flagella basal body P-ring formation protein FlgA [Gammaproteobacteria bacterium 45_16_T64]